MAQTSPPPSNSSASGRQPEPTYAQPRPSFSPAHPHSSSRSDPQASFDHNIDLDESENSVGVGLSILHSSDGALIVHDIVGPASEFVVKDDALLRVDGVTLQGKSDAAVRSLILGVPGTCAELELRRGSGVYTVRVTRGTAPKEGEES